MNTKDLLPDTAVRIMGILNTTPDSFSDGGSFDTLDKALKHATEMIEEGADIIDIGGESTRPGAAPLELETELERTIPVVRAIRQKHTSIPLSIDTYKSEVAKQAIEAGANIVNDISGMQFDTNMPKVIAELKCPIIINHIQGKPETMQQSPEYADVAQEIIHYFKQRIEVARKAGIKENQIILDPGFGFGKRIQDNIMLVHSLSEFAKLGYPLLLGVSRKGSLGKILKEELKLTQDPLPTDRLEAALAFTSVALSKGVGIIRTHDVVETRKFVKTLEKIHK